LGRHCHCQEFLVVAHLHLQDASRVLLVVLVLLKKGVLILKNLDLVLKRYYDARRVFADDHELGRAQQLLQVHLLQSLQVPNAEQPVLAYREQFVIRAVKLGRTGDFFVLSADSQRSWIHTHFNYIIYKPLLKIIQEFTSLNKVLWTIF